MSDQPTRVSIWEQGGRFPLHTVSLASFVKIPAPGLQIEVDGKLRSMERVLKCLDTYHIELRPLVGRRSG